MRLFALTLLAATVVSCASAPSPAQMSGPRARDFVPLAVGNRWEYRITGAPADSPNDKVEIVEKDDKGFFVDTRGRRLAPRTDGLFDGKRFLLQEPVETGHEWIAVPEGEAVLEKYKIVSVGTLTRVPAGTFEGCVEVEFTTTVVHATTQEKATVTMMSVYAPGVGLIKSFGTFAPEKGPGYTTPAMELVSYDVKPSG